MPRHYFDGKGAVLACNLHFRHGSPGREESMAPSRGKVQRRVPFLPMRRYGRMPDRRSYGVKRASGARFATMLCKDRNRFLPVFGRESPFPREGVPSDSEEVKVAGAPVEESPGTFAGVIVAGTLVTMRLDLPKR